MVWLWMYNPQYGLVNGFLSFLGIPGQAWLANPDCALWAVIVVGIWQGIGLKMLIYLAALQNIDESLYEAASIDGASKVQQFFRITLPMLKPATFFVFVVSVIGAFQVFDQVYVLTDGGPGQRHHDDDLRGLPQCLPELPDGHGVRPVGRALRASSSC